MMMKLKKQFIRRAERVNNPSQEPRDTLETHSYCIKPNQFSSTLEALTDIGYLTPPSRCVSGVASSASQNLRDCSKISLVQPQQEMYYLDIFHCNISGKIWNFSPTQN